MPYVYEVSFDIGRDKMDELEVGQSLERLVGYLKVRLPGQRGFVFTDAVYSVDDPEKTRIVIRSEWTDWSDLVRHRDSLLLEDSLLREFDPHAVVDRDSITVRRYAEVGSGPLAMRA